MAELAELSNTDVEIISAETEEGQMLKNAFGGIAAILRFKNASLTYGMLVLSIVLFSVTGSFRCYEIFLKTLFIGVELKSLSFDIISFAPVLMAAAKCNESS